MKLPSTLFEARLLGRTAPALALVLVSLLLLVACSGDDRPPGWWQTDSGDDSGVVSGPCEEGDIRECGITLEQANGILSCYRGKQICEDGSWSGCAYGSITKEPDPTSAETANFFRTQARSTVVPEACIGNPCDPSCRYFDEDPPDITPPPVGPGDPGIPDWSAPGGSATCTHPLCATGGPLDASCHPCVARVCATRPSCCGTSWDASCVNAVYTECAGTTPPVGLTLCDFNAFASTSISMGNGLQGKPVIGGGTFVYAETSNCDLGAVYSTGYVNLRNQCKVAGNVTATGHVYTEAGVNIAGSIFAGDYAELRNDTIIGGVVQARGRVSMQSGARVDQNVWSGGNIDLYGNARIVGNALSYLNITGQSGTRIQGSATVRSGQSIGAAPAPTVDGLRVTNGTVTVPPVPAVTLPDLSAYRRNLTVSCTLSALRPSITINSGNTQTLAPGVYGDVTVGGTLFLQGGASYIFRSLNFYSNASLRLLGSPKWDISVCSSFRTDGNFTAYRSPANVKTNAQDLIVYSAATTGQGIYIGDSNQIDAIFLAPDSEIQIRNGYTGTAAFWAKSIQGNTNNVLNPIAKEVCEGTNVNGNSQCGSVALYVNGLTYTEGARVHYRGRVYECLVPGWCTVGGGYGGGAGYWPGEGLNWALAWRSVEDCPPPLTNPSSCPVDLAIPAMPPARRPCYSGLDCQINSSCTEVLTRSACAHSKCVTGAALSASCDECVARICAAQPSCCSGTWDASCVARVETSCDATCGATTSVGCAHDACVVGSALNPACSSHVAAVCSSPGRAYCCSTTWDQACVDRLFVNETGSPPPTRPAETSICDYAVMGNGSASLYSTTIQGSVGWFSGSLQLAETWSGAGRPRVNGNLYNSGSVALSNTDVTGRVVYGGTGSQSGSTFTSFGMGSVPSVTRPNRTYTCPTGGTDNWAASGTLSPGTYGTVQLSGNLTLQAGTYYLQALSNWSGYTITLPATGDVNLYVCGDINIANSGRITSPASNPLQLFVYSRGAISFQDGVQVWGVFSTVGGNISTGQNVRIYGMAHSYWGVVLTNRGTVIDASGAAGNACITRGVDPVVPPSPTCPVTTPLTSTVVQSGTCVANGTTHRVATSYCPNADLAVDINCANNTIPVCNHGNQTMPANQAELVFYPRGGHQFATLTPTAAWEAGRCTITSAIPAGGCVDQVCSSTLLNRELTVRVAPRGSATVAECSALDNWSYYVPGRVCTSGGGSEVVNYEYEATCPGDSAPSWGLLMWQSSTPGASSIRFEARTATTSAGLAAAAFQEVGVARSSPDTQDCNIDNPLASCPVDLTRQLWGAGGRRNQPAFLELRISLEGAGANSPTLEDWQIMYSCVYDQ